MTPRCALRLQASSSARWSRCCCLPACCGPCLTAASRRALPPLCPQLLVLFGLPALVLLLCYAFNDPGALAVAVPLVLLIPGPRDVLLHVASDAWRAAIRARRFVSDSSSGEWENEAQRTGRRQRRWQQQQQQSQRAWRAAGVPPPPPPPPPMPTNMVSSQWACMASLGVCCRAHCAAARVRAAMLNSLRPVGTSPHPFTLPHSPPVRHCRSTFAGQTTASRLQQPHARRLQMAGHQPHSSASCRTHRSLRTGQQRCRHCSRLQHRRHPHMHHTTTAGHAPRPGSRSRSSSSLPAGAHLQPLCPLARRSGGGLPAVPGARLQKRSRRRPRAKAAAWRGLQPKAAPALTLASRSVRARRCLCAPSLRSSPS